MFKLLGSVSILIASAIFCFEAQRKEKEKLKQADAFISLLRYIKKQIECFSLSIDLILEQCDEELLIACGFNKIEASSKCSKILSELFADCIFYVDKEAIEILKAFARDFGRSYREQQLSSCDYHIAELIKYREKIATDLPKLQKIRFALSFSVSISLILLLY